ncbi:PepSY domain-containing protein [Robertkochia aurantiaca]|uniref:PepSY domain-containing protein n=1 Tax=Robertkochia aurantiaca TaxID=2873700 RepID=UPI001CCFCDDE|nr:PepSY domain-containing protein [Robertkochia sp. 3YJGBD-33]
MTPDQKRKKQARTLRLFRKAHRLTGAFLFVFFFFISISGIMLGLKKHVNHSLLPKTETGTSSELSEWLPLEELHKKAVITLHERVSPHASAELDKIDVRKDKGIAKFVFAEGNWGIQLDGATGEVLNVGRRHSDFLEDLHDGSVLDDLLGTSNEQIKVTYTTVTGLALLLFTITGFWLWYGPKRMKRNR